MRKIGRRDGALASLLHGLAKKGVSTPTTDAVPKTQDLLWSSLLFCRREERRWLTGQHLQGSRPDKHSVPKRALEVAYSLDAAVVLARAILELHADPNARDEGRLSCEANDSLCSWRLGRRRAGGPQGPTQRKVQLSEDSLSWTFR